MKRRFFCTILVLSLAQPLSLSYADSPAAANADVTKEKIRELRAKADQWREARLEFILITHHRSFGQETDIETKGEIRWSNDMMAATFKIERLSNVLAIIEPESYREYNMPIRQAIANDLNVLRKEFGKDVLHNCGLARTNDPFQGLREETLRFVREEKVGDDLTLVFEGEMWPQYSDENPVQQKESVWVGVEDGLVRQAEVYGMDGKRKARQTFQIKEKNLQPTEAGRIAHPEGNFVVIDETKDTFAWLKKHYGDFAPKK